MKYILKILLFLIICDACKRSDIDVFDIVEEITDYDSVYSDKNDVFNRITDMAILDSVLITKHMNDTYHFSFIDVNGKKIIKRLGKRRPSWLQRGPPRTSAAVRCHEAFRPSRYRLANLPKL